MERLEAIKRDLARKRYPRVVLCKASEASEVRALLDAETSRSLAALRSLFPVFAREAWSDGWIVFRPALLARRGG